MSIILGIGPVSTLASTFGFSFFSFFSFLSFLPPSLGAAASPSPTTAFLTASAADPTADPAAATAPVTAPTIDPAAVPSAATAFLSFFSFFGGTMTFRSGMARVETSTSRAG
jgi:hypothetical protein